MDAKGMNLGPLGVLSYSDESLPVAEKDFAAMATSVICERLQKKGYAIDDESGVGDRIKRIFEYHPAFRSLSEEGEKYELVLKMYKLLGRGLLGQLNSVAKDALDKVGEIDAEKEKLESLEWDYKEFCQRYQGDRGV